MVKNFCNNQVIIGNKNIYKLAFSKEDSFADVNLTLGIMAQTNELYQQ